MKFIIVLFLVVIVGSLASALFYLVRDKGGSDRTVKSLRGCCSAVLLFFKGLCPL